MAATVYHFEVRLVPELNTIDLSVTGSVPGSPVSLDRGSLDDDHELVEDCSPIPVGDALRGGLVTIRDLCGTAALDIVKRSLESVIVGNVDPCTVTRVSFDPDTKWYTASVYVTLPNDASSDCIVEAISGNYGPSSSAADTWMEGDIRVADGIGLGLDLVDVRDVDNDVTYVF